MGYGRLAAVLVAACGFGTVSVAQVSDANGPTPVLAQADALVYEGLLVHLGTPVDGEVDMVVTAWDRPLGGAALDGPTEYAAVLVEDGWFRVELEPTLLERGRGFAWLEVSVRWPAGLGEFETLDGRQRVDFGSVVYVPSDGEGGAARGGEPDGDGARVGASARTSAPIASGRRLAAGDRSGDVRAPVRGRLDGSSGTGGDGSEGGGGTRACDWTIVGDNVYYECGNVGVGTTNPLHRLHVVSSGQHAIYGVSTRTTNDFAYGVWGESASTSGRGVLGFATATTGGTCGVFGRSDSTSGRGVYGLATETSGINIGVHGQTNSTGGYGVHGSASATSGFTFGVSGRSDSTSGRGVAGIAYASSGATIGVQGLSSSTSGTGLYGEATAFSGTTYGVWAASNSTSGTGVYGVAGATSGTTVGVHGRSNSTGGRGVYGEATASSGTTYGVGGSSNSTSGTGVYGSASASTGGTYGVHGLSASTSGRGVNGTASAASGTTYGLYGLSSSTSGRGVYGIVPASTGTTYGVGGESASTSGRGVNGYASASTGTTYGVYGSSSSTGGRGVYGIATNSSGTTFGVSGFAKSTSGRGVLGVADASSGTTYGVWGESYSTSGRGVYGRAFSSGSEARGVFGRAPAPAVAVYANGNSVASGTKSFEIDHPLDPANRYLRHYCTEGHEPLNTYSGNVAFDDAGEAWVELPEYFEEINRDFRYQLTTIGGWGPVYVAIKIENNRFLIAGGRPGLEVSWRVEATRNDAYIRTYGAPVEIDKPESERGRYLHPEVLGQPKELAIDYDPDPIGPLPADGESAVRAAGD